MDHPVPHLLFTGKAGERMMVMMEKVQTNKARYANMEEAFEYLKSHSKPGDVCLLSPAASSYDQYKNFEERGRKYKQLAMAFGQV
jgi:UDP-N-acetylmuramoylalanine--D-glutamate ligase